MAGGEKQCDATSAIIFIVGLAAGTVCIIASKTLFELKAVGAYGVEEKFNPPVFETFIMFFGMCFALPLYWLMEGYKRIKAAGDPAAQAKLAAEPTITVTMLASLCVPAVFDLCSVLLMMAGLMHISASVWMLLRGGGIVFVALMKQFALNDKLSGAMWCGVFTIAVAVVMVGLASMVGDDDEDAPPSEAEDSAAEAEAVAASSDGGNVALGLVLTVAGTFMQSLQYAYEEKVMSGDNPAPPWLLIGMEGVFGSFLTLFVVYPIAGMVPGGDHGVFEDLGNTLAQLDSKPELVQLSAVFCVSVFVLNSFSVLVTFMLSSVWHAILDNFRPISIWATQLFIYYYVSDGAHGEKWASGSYLQLAGLGVMLLGTAIYNGTVVVPGLASKDLLAKGDLQSSPSLARSPLLSRGTSPPAFPGVNTEHARSPYAERFTAASNPMERGNLGDASEKFIVNVQR